MTVPNPANIHAHWNDRASLGETAGTQDLIAKELEHRAILSAVTSLKPSTILEIGCGRGELARLITSRLPGVEYLAIDNAREMIAQAKAQARNSRLRFACRGVEHLPAGHFDCVITERMLINLPSWEAQKAAIDAIAERLNPGGVYLMCENSQEGLDAINATRDAVKLPRIQPPWFNRYLREDEFDDLSTLVLVRCDHYSAEYYFLSRIVNALMAQEAGVEPAYDAPVNRVALKASGFVAPRYAQGRLWVWQKPEQFAP